jgi:hypothetical protein
VQRIYGLIIEGGLLSLVIGAPLAFGAVYPWGLASLELVVLLMALAWGATQLQAGRLQLVRTPLNWPMLLFLGVVSLQLLPLPPRSCASCRHRPTGSTSARSAAGRTATPCP